jgi:protein-tyrosine phosphatase
MLEHGRLVSILDALDDLKSHPTVIHCAVGRDRTGIVVACLLDVVGVSEDIITADYAMSRGVVEDGGGAEPETIVQLLQFIRRAFGSTHAMLEARGASPACVDRLVSDLLDDFA